MSTWAQPGRLRRPGRGLKTEDKSANSQFTQPPHTQKFGQPRGIGLTDEQRQPLATMVSNSMRGDRQTLRRLPDLREQIWLHASRKPDRSGNLSAADIADRRTELLRLFLLSGRNKTRAAEYYELLTGKPISRQALTRQLEAIEQATRMRSLASRS